MMRLALFALLLPVAALAQANLDFHDGMEGVPPNEWFELDGSSNVHFKVLWHPHCHGNAPCASIEAPANPPAGSFGSLLQNIDARPYRGKKVVLRAWVRAEGKAAGDHAQMLLHVTRAGQQTGFVDNMADRPITSGEWRRYEIRGDVAADATAVGIGLSLYGAGTGFLSEVEFGTTAEIALGPKVDAANDAIQKQYARMDSAFLRGNLSEIRAVLLPEAEMRVGTIREPLLPAIEKEITDGAKLTTRSEVAAVRVDGDEAFVMVRRIAQDPLSDGKRSVVTSHRDTWIHTPDSWRLRESIEVSYHWVMPPTRPEEVRAVAAELKTHAIPLNDSFDLSLFGAAVGDARIVALGESARGTREFTQWKQRLTEYLATKKGFSLVIGATDVEGRALVDRLHAESAAIEGATAEAQAASILRLASETFPQSKIVLWTDNTHARDPLLRQKFGRKLYSVGFAFHRGDLQAVGVQNGESRGLGVYSAPASPDGSGDAVLSAAAVPQFFLNVAKVPPGGTLGRWLAGTHLFHNLGAYWVLDDPDASLQPDELGKSYDGLLYVEELHATA